MSSTPENGAAQDNTDSDAGKTITEAQPEIHDVLHSNAEHAGSPGFSDEDDVLPQLEDGDPETSDADEVKESEGGKDARFRNVSTAEELPSDDATPSIPDDTPSVQVSGRIRQRSN